MQPSKPNISYFTSYSQEEKNNLEFYFVTLNNEIESKFICRYNFVCFLHMILNFFCLFYTVMTSPGPAFQECTGSCHVDVPAPKAVSS